MKKSILEVINDQKDKNSVESMLAMFNAGFFLGIMESLMFMALILLALPLLANSWLNERVAVVFPMVKSHLLVWFVCVLPLVMASFAACFICKYIVGSHTKRSIYSFIGGHLAALVNQGFIFFFVFAALSYVITPATASSFAHAVSLNNAVVASRFTQILMDMQPILFPRAFEVLGVLLIGAVVPFITVWGLTGYRKLTEKSV